MSTLIVPDDGADLWPSLGGQVVQWIEANLVFGPGDLRGEAARVEPDKEALIWRMYEVFPQDHPQAGRRRFKRVGISIAKGLAKTELAAWIAAAELHQDGPVRCIGWSNGQPIGGPVTDPYIPMVAYTEEQSDELAYGALKAILEESEIAEDFDIGLERIMRIGGDGKAVSLATSPNARDGARTTFQIADETHWWTLPKLKKAHQTMLANIPKRKAADAWSLEITTAYEPGAGSVAETTMDYARSIADGRTKDSRLFFFHRQAGDEHDIETEAGARAACTEATGSAIQWRDIDGIVELWRDPTTDRRYWERVWCNRPVQSAHKAFDVDAFKDLAADDEIEVEEGRLITLGFDGAQFHDATGLVATDVETGYQWVPGVWECPHGKDGEWQVPATEVDACVRDLFERYQVWRMYADPPFWQSWLAQWQGDFGDEVVIEWWTNRRRQMAYALELYESAIREGSLRHDGNAALVRHVGNSHREELLQRNEEGRRLWLIRKERPDSPYKIDLAMAAVLSWEARNDAIAAGATGGQSFWEAR